MTEHRGSENVELEELHDTGLVLADDDQDVRGRAVFDVHGDEIGHVSSLFIDAHERRVRMLEVRTGGFLGLGERHVLIPIDAITRVTRASVHVNESRDRVMRSPVYDPSLVKAPTQEYWEPFYGYYGLSPYWGSGYMYPTFPLSLDRREAVNEHAARAAER